MSVRELHGAPAYAEPRAEINIAASGDSVVIAGVAGRRTRIYSLVLWAQAALVLILKDGATPINGAGFNFAASGGGVLDFPHRPLTLSAGADFVMNLSTTGPLTGWVEYTQTG